MIREILLAGTGGFAGSAVRYLISVWALSHFPTGLPVGTFLVNILGAFLIGLFLPLASGNFYFLLVTGFCGGFTTFSAFSAEVLGLMRLGRMGIAVGYILLSVVLCVVFVALGAVVGNKIMQSKIM